MKILTDVSEYPKNVALILGFFDGVHLGHRAVVESAVEHARKNSIKTVLVTITPSPSEYFLKKSEYIFERKYSYSLLEDLGVDYLLELDFTSVVKMTAEEYLEEFLVKSFAPSSIFTGLNHTFGANKLGNSSFLADKSTGLGYKYFCVNPVVREHETISSTLIKSYLRAGNIEKANLYLGHDFRLKSKVITGRKLGRELGFPTANLLYPQKIVQIPFGVYKVKANGMDAILNWGVKPTIDGQTPVLEVHIFDFNDDIYGHDLEIKFIKKIRDEKCFSNLDELKVQIKKDIDTCLK